MDERDSRLPSTKSSTASRIGHRAGSAKPAARTDRPPRCVAVRLDRSSPRTPLRASSLVRRALHDLGRAAPAFGSGRGAAAGFRTSGLLPSRQAARARRRSAGARAVVSRNAAPLRRGALSAERGRSRLVRDAAVGLTPGESLLRRGAPVCRARGRLPGGLPARPRRKRNGPKADRPGRPPRLSLSTRTRWRSLRSPRFFS